MRSGSGVGAAPACVGAGGDPAPKDERAGGRSWAGGDIRGSGGVGGGSSIGGGEVCGGSGVCGGGVHGGLNDGDVRDSVGGAGVEANVSGISACCSG
ncbi:hypothetical protein GCM10025734_56570 [Kitasatospora paranensis]